MTTSALPTTIPVRQHRIAGTGGCALHVRDHGPQDAPALVLLHGLGFNGLVWQPQIEAFAQDQRVITVDLRGHGGSEKPLDDSYSHASTWADDVGAVLTELAPRSPVLVAWSYAGMIAADYLNHRGGSGLAGVCLVSPLRKIGTADAVDLLGDQFLGLVPGLLSTEMGDNLKAAREFVALARTEAWPEAYVYELLGAVLSVPPAVKAAMLSREQDNDAVWASTPVPLMLAYGADDSIIRSRSSEQLAQLVPGVHVVRYDAAGHSVFAERPAEFNQELRAFVDSCR